MKKQRRKYHPEIDFMKMFNDAKRLGWLNLPNSIPRNCDRCGKPYSVTEQEIRWEKWEYYNSQSQRVTDTRYDLCPDCRPYDECPKCDKGYKLRENRMCDECASLRVKIHRERGGVQNEDGYVKIRYPEHPRAKATGYVLEHILVMEEMIGRRLTEDETVHHKNGVRHDNRPENLELWASNHPSGQRVEDLVEWAIDLLRKYKPDALAATPESGE